MSTPLKILFVSAEVYPLVKTGGLADISHALPKALRQLGVDVRVLLPAYPPVLDRLTLTCEHDKVNLLHSLPPVRVLAGMMPDNSFPVYALDCPQLYQRSGGLYQDQHGNDWGDNALRFGALSKLAALFGQHYFTFQPDIIHCNDWQTGLTATYLAYSANPVHARVVQSLHNMAYQGIFDPAIMSVLELPAVSFNMYGLEYYGAVSFLKAGIYYSHWLSTVSPTYAKEIQTATFGYGLAGLLRERNNQLQGILNGIDVDDWNPRTDSYLPFHYSSEDFTGKAKNKQALCQRLGLMHPEKPLIAMITRLTYQKGLDLVLPAIADILNEGAQLALLGSGDKSLEYQLQSLAKQYQGRLSITIGYDETLAHQLEAGADIFLMPSRFEPCGLNQLYSMRYGTIPLVRRTGGLADTVTDTTPATLDKGNATGFVFDAEDHHAILHSVQRALLTYRDKATWRQLQLNGMLHDCSWQQSAKAYMVLYQHVLS
ncbi:glycogen synthase GlgA [Beggiatoa leptomitoformis]|uniref:Glycogen synthase n=1 Tax=Beggiatoa leptomitoformis TaxID=288004 RepID=A0A2N9YHY7_9GAMM|nr:glycogen synthase GlgA [Beggiatoa leptomitoformis]ALG67638.1 glycogen synthase GlgA [Beggiatoa leptomitoformis]AUI70127.1 glycogen synthase GlgA [Beggiatoa leptomitoformis]